MLCAIGDNDPRNSLNHASSMAISIIRDGRIFACNNKSLQLFGRSLDDFIGSRPEQFSPLKQPDGLDSAAKASLKMTAALSGTPQFFEWRHLRRNGDPFDAEVSLNRIEFQDNSGLLAVIRDISERKMIEAALRESEAKFDLSLQTTPLSLTITSLNEGRFVEINEAFERVTGFKREDIIGRTALEISIWETPQDRNTFIMKLKEEGRLRDHEARFRSKYGEVVVALVSAEIIEIGGEDFLLLFLNDITACRRAEKALLESNRLLESEKRFRLLFEHMLDAVVYGRMIYDENGAPVDFVYLDANSAYGEQTGFRDVVGKRASEILPGSRVSASEPFEVYGRVAATGIPEKCELYFQQLSLWRSLSVYSTEKGYFVAVAEDISERKRMEAELRESHRKLQEHAVHLTVSKELQLKALARKVHDELGTYLTLLKFDLAWLKRNHPGSDPVVSERFVSMGNLIHECTDTVQRLTAELRPSLLDEQGLAAAIEWQAAEFEKRAAITCVTKIESSLLPLSQDRSINVYRIFQEALSNVVRHAGAASVSISLAREGERLVLCIADDGLGISDEEIDASTSFGILGMQERARLCGGAISIKGTPGRGTTVTLSTPL